MKGGTEDEQTLALREHLVDTLLRAGQLRSERVTAAFRAVPRHTFVPQIDPRRAYRDEALPTKWEAGGQPVSSSSQPAIMAAMLEQLNVEPGQRVSDVRVTAQDVWGGLGLWLALHEPHIAQLSATGPALERELVPPLIAFPGHAVTSALIVGRALAALVRLDCGEARTFELGARPFGPGGQALAHRLVEHVRAWDAHGRPSTGGLHISAYPRGTAVPEHAATIIDKRYSRLVLSWEPTPAA